MRYRICSTDLIDPVDVAPKDYISGFDNINPHRIEYTELWKVLDNVGRPFVDSNKCVPSFTGQRCLFVRQGGVNNRDIAKDKKYKFKKHILQPVRNFVLQKYGVDISDSFDMLLHYGDSTLFLAEVKTR